MITTSSVERITAHGTSVRRLGHWTASRGLAVRASRASVVLDLRSPRIQAGDIEVDLDADHSMVKLLVPDGAALDHDGLRRTGRCGYVDWGGAPAAQAGRRVRLTGELRGSELRINRGGVAIVSAMLTPEYLQDLRRLYREGRWRSLADVQRAYREGPWTAIDDPGRLA